MKPGKLYVLIGTMSLALVTFSLLPACKDKKSENNSTELDTMMANPVTTPSGDTTMVKTTGKRSGKISTAAATVDKSGAMQTDAQGIYNYTESAPAYPGGQSSMEDYITKNLVYPQDAIDNGIQGTVNVKFTVDQNGKVANAQTSGTPLGYGLEEAAMKVISNMPRWTPGMVNGKRVKTWFTLPVTYRIEE